MEIITFYSDDGPWASFTHGHVDLADFAKALMKDDEASEILKNEAEFSGEKYGLDYILSRCDFLHMRRQQREELREMGADESAIMYEWCLPHHPDAQHVTAYTYEP